MLLNQSQPANKPIASRAFAGDIGKMKLPTPIGLLKEKGVIGEILRQLPRRALDEAKQQRDPWTWLAKWVKKNHWPDSFRKTFEAAASQRKALNVLAQVARGGGSISNHDWHLKILAAEKQGDWKAAQRLTKKHLASILQTVRGRRWLLEDKEKGLSAPPGMRDWARCQYKAFYAADVHHLGRKKADEKWKGTATPRLKLGANDDDYIAVAMAMEWLVVGKNGFPGLCFMSDGLLAQLLGRALPVPNLGWKTVSVIRERMGLKKAKTLFAGMVKAGDNWWVLLDRSGNKTRYRISFPKAKLLPQKL